MCLYALLDYIYLEIYIPSLLTLFYTYAFDSDLLGPLLITILEHSPHNYHDVEMLVIIYKHTCFFKQIQIHPLFLPANIQQEPF